MVGEVNQTRMCGDWPLLGQNQTRQVEAVKELANPEAEPQTPRRITRQIMQGPRRHMRHQYQQEETNNNATERFTVEEKWIE